MSERFPKSARLLKRPEFLAFSGPGVFKARTGAFLLLARANGLDWGRLGVTATKKIGCAVRRNLIKRQAREYFRRSPWVRRGYDIVIIAQRGASSRTRKELWADLGRAGGELDQRLSRNAGRPDRPEAESRPKPSALRPLWRSCLLWVPLGLIWVYRNLLSPFFPPACRFRPTCSEYAAEAFKVHGLGRGFYWTVRRLLRCHPWGGSGYDPVPPAVGRPSEKTDSASGGDFIHMLER